MNRTNSISQQLPHIEKYMPPSAKLPALTAYESAMLNLIYNSDHASHLTLRDGTNHFREMARERGLEESTVIQTAIQDMELIGKELATARAGASGERAVEKALRYVDRRKATLSNVILSDGEDRTELDQVVITSNGILILEVKNYKADITITEAGQVYGFKRKHLSDKSLGDHMNLKRYLLRKKIEEELGNLDILVHIESRIVFSNPSISVTDNYQLEKYCFTATLPQEVEAFTSDVEYGLDEMKIIAAVIESVAEEEMVYDIGLDFERINENFAEALILLENQTGENHLCGSGSDDQTSTEAKALSQNFGHTLVQECREHPKVAWAAGLAGLALGAGIVCCFVRKGN